MRCFNFDSERGRSIEAFNSRGATVVRLLRHTEAFVVSIYLEPNGVLGMHPATEDQLFLVIAGGGQAVAGAERCDLSPGMAVLWQSGEEHETRAGKEGLAAIVIEGEELVHAVADSGPNPNSRSC